MTEQSFISILSFKISELFTVFGKFIYQRRMQARLLVLFLYSHSNQSHHSCTSQQ